MKPLIGTDLKRFLRDYRRENRPKRHLTAILHSVEYPANVGSAFRIADGVGLDELILTGITPQPPNATIEKVGRNKQRTVQWRYEKDPLVAIDQLKKEGYTIAAVELTAEALPYHECDYPEKLCLIVGNEDHGVTKKVLAHCDAALFVPMYGKGLSLNVHVALGVVAFHARHAD